MPRSICSSIGTNIAICWDDIPIFYRLTKKDGAIILEKNNKLYGFIVYNSENNILTKIKDEKPIIEFIPVDIYHLFQYLPLFNRDYVEDLTEAARIKQQENAGFLLELEDAGINVRIYKDERRMFRATTYSTRKQNYLILPKYIQTSVMNGIGLIDMNNPYLVKFSLFEKEQLFSELTATDKKKFNSIISKIKGKLAVDVL
jgi:hypothetical protein